MSVNPISFVTEEVRALPVMQGVRSPAGERLAAFGRRACDAVRLALQEKEILLFAVLQWAVVAGAYYLWVQFLGWIPAEVWEEVRRDENRGGGLLLNLALIAWSFVCVGAAAFPIGILTGAMAASHLLRATGRPSTIDRCLALATRRVWALWIFSWIDGWITVNQILDRLPKKNRRRSRAQRALDEALYYAWKVGTIGVVPGLVCGHDIIEAGKRSVRLVKNRFIDVALLRGGYSLVCWVVAIVAYVAPIALLKWFPSLRPEMPSIFSFYVLAGIPILIAALVIQVFVRPIYVLASAALYAETFGKPGARAAPHDAPARWPVEALVAFALVAAALAAAVLFRDELGITELLSMYH